MTTIAVAGLSARMMAEAASRDGFDVVALDVFGDADTRRAASAWRPIGMPGSLRIDATPLLAVLRELAARGDVAGWVAGSGFDGLPHLLSHGARLLPLIGTAACNVRRLRDPATFFAALQSHRIAHPPTSLQAPADRSGWLRKDMHSCGGWHIRDAASAPPSIAAHRYFQRRSPGVPMSATFIGNGERALVLGINELTVRRIGAHPFVYAGAVGPVDVAPLITAQVDAALRSLVPAFGLRGLCSLDFMRDGEQFEVLEVNPRPPASMALYEGRVAGGLMAAHVAASVEGELPDAVLPLPVLRGTEIVFARHAMPIDEAAASVIAHWPGTHDLPAEGTTVGARDPLCSLGASGASAAQVRDALASARAGLLGRLESLLETST